MKNKRHSNIIDLLGGTVAVARICDIKPQAVSQWRNNGIPKPWEKLLRHTHPELFADDSGMPTGDKRG